MKATHIVGHSPLGGGGGVESELQIVSDMRQKLNG